ncbi:MAG: hypothetical protein RLZZ50_1376 [Verrucomicrobiota bacterium]|jgi:hypothetical protein
MKSIRSLAALLFAFAIAGSVAFAGHHEEKKSDSKPAKAACGCETGKDGKVCGTDKDCCCSGEKAKGKSDEKKAEKSDKKSARSGSCAPCATC